MPNAPKTFSQLIGDLEFARDEERRAHQRLQDAKSAHATQLSAVLSAERALADAIHLLGKPVCKGDRVYRLAGVGDRCSLQVVEFVSAYSTEVPTPPADLTADQAAQIWAGATGATAEVDADASVSAAVVVS